MVVTADVGLVGTVRGMSYSSDLTDGAHGRLGLSRRPLRTRSTVAGLSPACSAISEGWALEQVEKALDAYAGRRSNDRA